MGDSSLVLQLYRVRKVEEWTCSKSVIQGVFFSLLGGLAIATIIWYFVNQYMRIQRPHSPEQSVEWLYAVDIHFNSFFPVVLLVGILQVGSMQ